MLFNDFIKINLKKGALGLLFALFFFFYFNLWRKLSFFLTNEEALYVTNLLQVNEGVKPILAYNWWTLFLAIILSLIIGYFLSAILFYTLFKVGVKSFFAYSKTKLFITIGLFLFSIILGFVVSERGLFYLSPLENFFNISNFLEGFLRDLLGNLVTVIIFWPLWIFHMYFYSCLIIYFKNILKKD